MRFVRKRENAAGHFEAGQERYLLRDYHGAIKEFTRAIRDRPDVPEPYQQRGLAYARSGRLEEAARDFEAVVEILGSLPQLTEVGHHLMVDAHYNCALTYEKLGRYPIALRHYDQAIELHPEHSMAWCNRGNCLLQQGDFREARESHTKAIELNPSDYRAYWGRAIANKQLGRLDPVEADLRKYLEIAPANDENVEAARSFLGRVST